MSMIIQVGTLVLCHLIIKAPAGGDQTQKIQQVPGIVKEISHTDKIEMFEDKYAIKKDRVMLLVEPEEKDKIFKIGADACRPVIDEQTHLEIAKKKMKEQAEREARLRKEKEEALKDAKAPMQQASDELAQPPTVPADNSNEDLLQQLNEKPTAPKKKDEAPKREEVTPSKKAEKEISQDKADLLKQLEE